MLPGQVYSYTIWLKSENLVGGHLKFVWWNATDELGESYPVRGLSGDLNDWTEFHGQVAAPPGATKAEIMIWHGLSEGVNTPGSILWIDDISVTPIECTSAQLCNPDFEEGTNGWSFSGTTELLSPGRRGNYALSSTQNEPITATTSWKGIHQTVQVLADQHYDFTAWLNAENATGVHMKVEWFDSVGQQINVTYLGGPPDYSAGWVKEGGEVTAPANASMAEIIIWHGVEESQNVPGSNLLIDDVSFAIQLPLVEPAANTHNASLTSNLTITMSQSVSQTTVTPQTIPVHSGFQGSLDGTFAVSGETITFDPDTSFHPGELVQTTVTTDVVPLENRYVWQFRADVTSGSGIFAESGQSLGDSYSEGIALGDVDKDGDLDAFIANYHSQINKVWLNDGSGIFTDSGQNLGNSLSRYVVLGDVDGDGDLDAFVANISGQANKVWLNDGAGQFQDSGQSLGNSTSQVVELGDVDSDGDLDAFIGNWGQPNEVWLNDGSGTFTDSGQSLGNSESRGIALGDIDGDGDLDAFVANYNHYKANKVWLNDGSGTFIDTGQSLGDSYSEAVVLGDMDNDGDLDAFVPNYGEANKVWLNNGNGTFFDSGQSLGNSQSYAVDLKDIDSDGDLDTFVGNWEQVNKVWLNDGSGTFADSGQNLGAFASRGVALGDVDGDNDIDAFVVNSSQGNKVWLNQNIIFVDGSATGANDGTSWVNAFTDLQDALAAAEAGDEIWVAQGTYKPTDDGDRTISFQLKNGLALYGGFNGTETARDQRNWEFYPTILSGDLSENDNHNVNPDEPTRADNSYHVMIGSNTDQSAILDSFTISGGNANGIDSDSYGGGMFNDNSSPKVNDVTFASNSAVSNGGGMFNRNSNPTVSHVAFNNNSAGSDGGGMFNTSSSPWLNYVAFRNNSAQDGGGMLNTTSNPTLSHVIFAYNSVLPGSGGGMLNTNNSAPTLTSVMFIGNSSDSDGGGLYNNGNSNPTLTSVTFNGNSSRLDGGGIFNENSNPTLNNIIFTGNLAQDGGGVLNWNGSNPTIVNATFSGNSALGNGGGIHNVNNSNPTISNSILWNNKDNSGIGVSAQISGETPTVTYSLVQGGYAGTGNIDSNPLFVSPINPGDAPTITGDFHLSPTSPAIDAGDNSAVPADTVDLDGDSDTNEPLPFDLDGSTRFRDHAAADTGNGTAPIVDMGAYETGSIIYVKADAAGANNGTSWADAYANLQDGLAAATSGNEIWVAAGTYKPTDDGNREVAFVLKNGVRLYGGFNGTETAHTQRDWETNQTILSGDLDGNDNDNIVHDEPTRSDNSIHVLWAYSIDESAKVDGFVIRSGNGNISGGASDDSGGMRNDLSRPTLSNLVFMNNTALYAAGMYNAHSSPTLINVTFNNNVAEYAGGMLNYANSNPTLLHVTFINNVATTFSGGGMYNHISTPILNQVTFTGNSAAINAGGMYNKQSHPIITDATFTSNVASYGGGMLNTESNPTINNATFTDNSVSDDGGGMYNKESSPQLYNVTFTGNQANGEGGHLTDHGGGIFCTESRLTLVNVLFKDNFANAVGGGMANYINCHAELSNVTFSNNSAMDDGGGLFNYESHTILNNVTFTGNSADGGVDGAGADPLDDGGGMHNNNSTAILNNVHFSGNRAKSFGGAMGSYQSTATLNNVTFSGNYSPVGGGISHYDSTVTISNSILWNNKDQNGTGATSQIHNHDNSPVTVTYSLVQGGWSGTGNLDSDPLFVSPINPDDAPTITGDFHLEPTSPAIDAGDNSAVPADTLDLDGDGDTSEPVPFDLDGEPRFRDTPVPDTGNGTAPIVDMGAYENGATGVIISEVAWAGTHASGGAEWIELFNNSDDEINLSGWTLSTSDSSTISLVGVISANGYYLLERADDTVDDIPADLVYSGTLNDAGDVLSLRDNRGQVVDTANSNGGMWPAGNGEVTLYHKSFEFSTMERIDPLAPDTDANWATNDTIHRNGQDADGQPINGTPKQANSIAFAEADDSCVGATEITLNNNASEPYTSLLRAHSDVDFFKFEVPDEYTTIVATLSQPADFDFRLHRTCNGTIGDIYNIGQGSETSENVIRFDVARQTGPFYLKVSAPPGSYSGEPYQLQIELQLTNVSSVRTLIFYNHMRFSDQFGINAASQVMGQLSELADDDNVDGAIVQLDLYPEVQAAYDEWDATPISPARQNVQKANAVADAIREVMRENLDIDKFPRTEYIVIVGDDHQIPFGRIDVNPPFSAGDPSWVYESQYPLNSVDSPIGAALQANQTLTDDLYGDYLDRRVYLPELAVGRLLDTPERILSMIQAFLDQNGEIALDTATVAGHGFLVDAAEAQCQSLSDAGLTCNSMIDLDPPYTGQELYNVFVTDTPDIASYNWHTNHTAFQAPGPVPDGSPLHAQTILDSVVDLRGQLWWSVGCQTGLVTPNDNQYQLSVAQALSTHGVSYVGNTGWAWGGADALILSERLYQLFTQNLIDNSSIAIGEALREAKKKYLMQSFFYFTYYDEKVMSQATLFGLPMLRVRVPDQPDATEGSNQEKSAKTVNKIVTVNPEAASASDWTTPTGELRFDSLIPLDFHPTTITPENLSHKQTPGANGDYYTGPEGEMAADPGQPILPQDEHFNFETSLGEGHGVIWLGGNYNEQNNDPVINTVATLNSEPSNELEFDGVHPRIPVSLTTIESRDPDVPFSNRMLFTTGQFDGQHQEGRLRLFTDMSFLVGISTNDDDFTPPELGELSTSYDGQSLRLSLPISDTSGIYRAVVTYTEIDNPSGSGSWRSADLESTDNQLYMGTLTLSGSITYFIQVMDYAGNVSTLLPENAYFTSRMTSAINIQLGWNHIALPVEPLEPISVAEVCNQINSQGGHIVEIDRWHNGGWQGHICGHSFNSFELTMGEGYFIKSEGASSWTIEGTPINTPISLQLQEGWNSIAIGHTDTYTAESLCDQIINQGVSAIEIDRWHLGGWQGHLCGLPFNDFEIEPGTGYFIKSNLAGTVTPTQP